MKKVIATAAAPQAVGPYSQAVEADGTVYVSGQLPIDPISGTMPDTVARQTEQSLLNIGAILAEAGCSFDNVVKSTVLLDDISNFGAMNEVYARSGRGAAQRRKSRDRCDRRKIDAVRLSYRENDRTATSGRFCRWESVAGRAAACGLIRSRGFSGFRSDRRTGSGRSLRRPIS